MGAVVGGMKALKGGKPAQEVANDLVGKPTSATSLTGNDTASRTMAEELAAKKTARTRGGSRALLSDARVNAQEGLSATSTLG